MSEVRDDLADLFARVRGHQASLLDDERRAAVRQRLAYTEPAQARMSSRLWLGGLSAAALAAAVLALVYWPGAEDGSAAVAYEVEGRAAQAGEFLSTAGQESMTLRFSEGSVIRLEARTTARVEQLTDRGAQLRLEHGTANIDVRHRSETRWRVQTGPYVVHVVGTRFRVSWDAPRRDFSLVVQEGRVVVDGSFGRQSLSAGQSLHIGPDGRSVRTTTASSPTAVADGDPDDGEEPAPVDEPGAPPTAEAADRDPPEAVTSSARPTTRARPPAPRAAISERAAPPRDWRDHLRAGDHRSALAAIGDMDAVTPEATPGELRALGTAARRAQSEWEPRIYEALRARFPGTPDAAEAAFLTGRRHHRLGRYEAADRWFSTYLREAPDGPWAAEVSGRHIETARALGQDEETRARARRYLSRYPAGSHSVLARRLVDAR